MLVLEGGIRIYKKQDVLQSRLFWLPIVIAQLLLAICLAIYGARVAESVVAKTWVVVLFAANARLFLATASVLRFQKLCNAFIVDKNDTVLAYLYGKDGAFVRDVSLADAKAQVVPNAFTSLTISHTQTILKTAKTLAAIHTNIEVVIDGKRLQRYFNVFLGYRRHPPNLPQLVGALCTDFVAHNAERIRLAPQLDRLTEEFDTDFFEFLQQQLAPLGLRAFSTFRIEAITLS